MNKRCFYTVMLACGCLLASNGLGQLPTRMIDPLFGIEFDPKTVHFDAVPPIIMERCRELKARNLLVFARTTKAGITYYILNGYVQYQPDGRQTTPPSYEPSSGMGVLLSPSGCDVVSADDLLAGVIPRGRRSGFPSAVEDVSEQLSNDLLKRLSTAFGGPMKLKPLLSKAVAAHDTYESKLPPSLRSDYPPRLREVVEAFLRN